MMNTVLWYKGSSCMKENLFSEVSVI